MAPPARIWLLVFLVFGGLLPAKVCAQTASPPAADSLRAVLRTAQDTTRARSLGRLGNAFVNAGVLDSALHYGTQGLQLSHSLSDSLGLAIAHSVVGYALLIQGNYDSALVHNQHCADLYRSLGYTKQADYRLNLVGLSLNHQGRYDEAIVAFQRCIDAGLAFGDSQRVAGSLNNMGNSFESTHRLPRALEVYLRAYRINLAMGNEAWAAINQNNLALVYQKLNDLPRALQCLQTALEINTRIHNVFDAAMNLDNIGSVLKAMDSLPQAEEYYRRSIALLEADNPQSPHPEVAASLHNIGALFRIRGNLDSAMVYVTRAYAINRTSGNKDWQHLNLVEMAHIHILRGQHAQAIPHLRLALTYAEELDNPDYVASTLQFLAKALGGTGQYAEAFRVHERYIALRDSLYNSSLEREIGRIETRFEMEEEAAAQAAQAAREQEEARRKNDQQYLLIFGGLSLLFLLGILLTRLRLSVSAKLTQGLLFLTMLLFFESVLVYLDPIMDAYTGGVPLPKLGVNGLLALCFTLLHQVLERRMRTQ